MVARDTLEHRRARVNGVKLHYVTAGEGPPLVLLHGWPQTWYEWRDVIPDLADEYTVIAPDLRGLGDSRHRLRLRQRHRRDRRSRTGPRARVRRRPDRACRPRLGMPTAYAYAAQYRDEIRALCVLEAGLPGINEDEKRHLWHTRFHGVRDLPERLVAGRERLYLDWFYKEGRTIRRRSTTRPATEYVRCYSQAGGLRGGFEYYRAYETDAEHNRTRRGPEVPLALGGAVSVPIRTWSCRPVEGGSSHWIPEEDRRTFDRLTAFPTDMAAVAVLDRSGAVDAEIVGETGDVVVGAIVLLNVGVGDQPRLEVRLLGGVFAEDRRMLACFAERPADSTATASD